jgi:pimeloyl-ACP methyl ester carboxylesterase
MKFILFYPLLVLLVGPAWLPLVANAQTAAASPSVSPSPAQAARRAPAAATQDFHGYTCRNFQVDGCDAKLVEPPTPLPGRPWVWRTLFWDAYPGLDIEMLKRGFYVAYIGVGNTFGSPDALRHFDAFYATMTGEYGLSEKPALEGLSRGGLSAYRWASEHPEKVGCIYGDAPVCDMKSWPGGRGKGTGSKPDWALAIQAYHFTDEQQLLDYKGNPVDALAPLAAAHVPIIHVVGDADTTVPPAENTDVVRERYMKAGGTFVEIVKQGCGHHPHGLADPTPVADFIVAHCAGGEVAQAAAGVAPPPGARIVLPPGRW